MVPSESTVAPEPTALLVLQESNSDPSPTAVPTQSNDSALRFVGGAPLDYGGIEHHVIRLTNAERQRAGLAILKVDPDISRIARAHSQDKLRYGTLNHVIGGLDPTDRAMNCQWR